MIPLRDNNTVRTFPFVNYSLMAINVLVFIYTLLLSSRGLREFTVSYALIPAFISQGQNLYTIFTSMFMHAGFGHIIGNMMFLNIFGDDIEGALGHFKYLLFYLVCGVGGAALQFVTGPYSPIPNLGASGAIAGVMGAYLILFPHSQIEVLALSFFVYRRVYVPAHFMLLYWVLAQFLYGVGSLASVSLGGVAYFSHIGGFATGWLLTKLFAKTLRRKLVAYWGW